MIENANEILFRCSGLGHIMTGSKGITEKQLQTLSELLAKPKRTEKQNDTLRDLIEKRDAPPELAQTVKTNLIDIFVSAKYGRREEITSKFLTKGNLCENDAITLLSRVSKIFFKKNDLRIANEMIIGEPDLFIGESLKESSETFDTKTSWSAHTFFRAKNEALNDNYYWQGQGYMCLTGATKHTVAYCLVNGTPETIIYEKCKAATSMGLPYSRDFDTLHSFATEDTGLMKKFRQIEINHIFDMELFERHNPGFQLENKIEKWQYDIPLEERLHLISFEYNQSDIDKLYERITACKSWMNKFLFKSELLTTTL